MKRKKIKADTKIPVKLTNREHTLIIDETQCDQDLLTLGAVKGRSVTFELSLYDIEEIQGYIAAEANHTENGKLQKELDRIFEKLQDIMDKYDIEDD